MDGSIRRSLLLSFLVLAPVLVAQQGPRQPRGVYAVVNVEDAINQAQKSNPSITTAQLDAYFDTFYQGLLADPAISGLTLQVHWDTVNPNAPPAANAYFWNYVDDASSQVSAWNAQNPYGTPKTIQLIVSAGFQTPQWMLNQLTSCDGLFATPVQTPPSTCGKATFLGYQEGGDSTELPMPWNPLYKSAWQTFLTVLAVRYGVNPAFVSIAIAGPTGASAEMILPSDANSNNPQTQFGASISPSHMWLQLLALEYPSLPAYQNSDQAFIAEWEHAIDLYGQIFSGITLVATTGNGFPNFAGATVAIPSGYTADCVTPDLDCAAETTILSYFAQGAVGGANAKASQNSGMEASRVNINLSVPGVKQLSASTAQFTSPSYQILGGAQFNTSFVNDTLAEGCIDTFPPNASDTPADCTIPATCTANGCIPVQCIPQACLAPGVTQASLAIYQTYGKVPVNSLIPPEQAEYNVLSFYFSGTAVASSFGGTQGLAPLNYLQIYSEDIQYAEANVNAPAQVVQASGAVVSMTAQDLLNLASQKLLQLAEDGPAISLVANAEGESPIIAPNTWVEVKGSNLAPAGDTRIWQLSDFVNNKMPTQLDGVSATVNGKAAYVYYISPTQVNILTPPDAMAGAVQVVVTNNGSMSAAYTAQAQPLAPSFFVINGGPYALGQHGADSSLAGPASFSVPGYTFTPARPGEVVVLYANGFGAVSPAVVSGSSSQTGTLNPLPAVTIGGIAATVQFAGINGPPGLFQLNVVVPSTLANGDQPITATYNGATTQAGTLITMQH